MYLTVKRLRRYITGHHLTIFTDNTSLMHNISKPRDQSYMINRRLALISEYATEVEYIPTKSNIAADYFSRLAKVNVLYWKTKIDYRRLFLSQSTDQWCKTLHEDDDYKKRREFIYNVLYTF